MSHSNVLKLLLPISLEGVFDQDIEIEGAHLDSAQNRAQELLGEMFPDGAHDLLPDWERVCGVIPGESDPLQLRKDRVIRQLRSKGGLSRQYFISLAAEMGFQITIDELCQFMAGIGRAGDALYEEECIFIWRVNVMNQPLFYFRAGQSASGELLLWWPVETVLENLFIELKPAHTFVYFIYY